MTELRGRADPRNFSRPMPPWQAACRLHLLELLRATSQGFVAQPSVSSCSVGRLVKDPRIPQDAAGRREVDESPLTRRGDGVQPSLSSRRVSRGGTHARPRPSGSEHAVGRPHSAAYRRGPSP